MTFDCTAKYNWLSKRKQFFLKAGFKTGFFIAAIQETFQNPFAEKAIYTDKIHIDSSDLNDRNHDLNATTKKALSIYY